MRNSDPRVRIVFVYRFNSNFHSIFTLQVAGCDSQHGPNLVFPRIQPFGSDKSSSLGKVYSRQATASVNCENYSVSFVMRYISLATGLTMLVFLACLARHGWSHWCFQFSSCILNGFLELLVLRVNEIDSS